MHNYVKYFVSCSKFQHACFKLIKILIKTIVKTTLCAMFFFVRQFLIWKALLTSKKNWQQSNFQLVSNPEHCYLLAHLNIRFTLAKKNPANLDVLNNLLLVPTFCADLCLHQTSKKDALKTPRYIQRCFLLPVSAPAQDNSDVEEIFRQERVRLQQIRSDQESARSSPESRMHRKQEIDKIRKRPNQSVPGSKLVVYVFCLSLGTVIVIFLVVTKI